MLAPSSSSARRRRARWQWLLALPMTALLFAAAVLGPATEAQASLWWGTKAHDAPEVPAFGVRGSSLPPRFESPLGRHHPLSGRVFDVRRARFVTPSQMLEDLSGVDLVLLGEQHDNVDHHRLQAWLLDGIAARGRRPGVVFEMIDADKQGDVDRSLQAAPSGVDELAAAINWDKSGWPPFAIYRPVFAAAVSRSLPIVAAGLSRTRLAAADFMAAEGVEGEDPALRVALPDHLREVLAADIRDSHCGYAHEEMITAMIAVQRRRDLAMARALLAAATADRAGAVLIAGAGHARSDYAVPMVLRQLDESARVRSLGFLEVHPGAYRPAVYAEALRGGTLPFDYVWFTPRAKDEDPCKLFRSQLENMGSKGGPGKAVDHGATPGVDSGATTPGVDSGAGSGEAGSNATSRPPRDR